MFQDSLIPKSSSESKVPSAEKLVTSAKDAAKPATEAKPAQEPAKKRQTLIQSLFPRSVHGAPGEASTGEGETKHSPDFLAGVQEGYATVPTEALEILHQQGYKFLFKDTVVNNGSEVSGATNTEENIIRLAESSEGKPVNRDYIDDVIRHEVVHALTMDGPEADAIRARKTEIYNEGAIIAEENPLLTNDARKAQLDLSATNLFKDGNDEIRHAKGLDDFNTVFEKERERYHEQLKSIPPDKVDQFTKDMEYYLQNPEEAEAEMGGIIMGGGKNAFMSKFFEKNFPESMTEIHRFLNKRLGRKLPYDYPPDFKFPNKIP